MTTKYSYDSLHALCEGFYDWDPQKTSEQTLPSSLKINTGVSDYSRVSKS